MFGAAAQHKDFEGLLDALGAEWRFDSLIHGDMKWDNVLVYPAGDGLDFRIADWEMADFGDAAWDVGAVLQSFFSTWIMSMPIASGLPPEAYIGMAAEPVEAMRPVLGLSGRLTRKCEASAKRRAGRSSIRCMRFGAARLDLVGDRAAPVRFPARPGGDGPPAGEPQHSQGSAARGAGLLMPKRRTPPNLEGPTGSRPRSRRSTSGRQSSSRSPEKSPIDVRSLLVTPPWGGAPRARWRGAISSPGDPGGALRPLLRGAWNSGGEGKVPEYPAGFAAKLSAANSGKERWDRGWIIQQFGPNGQVFVRKGDSERAAMPGAFIFDGPPGMAPQMGSQITIRAPCGTLDAQPGYYFAFGETLDELADQLSLTRLYFHCPVQSAVSLVGELAGALNRFQTPFQLKTPAAPTLYGRTDAAVLYVAQRYFPIVARIVSQAREKSTIRGVNSALRQEAVARDRRCGRAGFGRKLRLASVPSNSRGNRRMCGGKANKETSRASRRSDEDFARRGSTSSARGSARMAMIFFNSRRVREAAVTAGRDRFLSAAAAIGRRLCRDAVWHEGRCNWLGWAMEPHGGQWVSAYRAMGALVYDGAAGIGLFLSRLARFTGDPIIATTAEGALAQALSAVAELKRASEYGFYSGLAGVAQVCMASGEALEREDIVGRGKSTMAACAELEPDSRRLDIINGSAGAIPALLDAAERFGREEFLMAAVRHGEHLMKLAARGDKGWSWDTLGMEGQPHLLGFAHGASGIAYALARVGAATGRRDFLGAAREGLRYERAYFRETEGNWPDLRSFVQAGPSGEAPCMIAWCHGAPGIGFARIRFPSGSFPTSRPF